MYQGKFLLASSSNGSLLFHENRLPGNLIGTFPALKDAEQFQIAYELLRSLTPPEGIEAAETTVNVVECIPGQWYYWDDNDGKCPWWRASQKAGANQGRVFTQIRHGELYDTWFMCTTVMHPVRTAPETTVGELDLGQEVFIHSTDNSPVVNRYRRVSPKTNPESIPMLEINDDYVYQMPPETPCTHIPKE